MSEGQQMQEPLAPEARPDSPSLETALHSFGWSPRQCLLLVAFNLLPLAHVVVVAAIALVPWAGWPWRALVCLAGLYVAPPLVARVVRFWLPIRHGWIPIGSRDYFVWWFQLNLQVLFCRFPALEECLRLVPKLYSAWLRLWGSRIGRYVYWAPGVCIYDRSFLDVGDAVVFGANVRLTPHVVARNAQGDMQLALAPIQIGDRVMVGAHSVLTAGTRIAAGECTRACLLTSPFSEWAEGRRRKPDAA
ncbi:MAG: hypothetical protein A3K19_13415 [Lentisphaerae bacterium RIFOXYB12_FULL_65_16]|nr:MAG: hypothetical protein A3K18_28935 [Lentisphaerae bacterium RIFOXYA12_64_32]OGV86292.1 MAG: hypothetical protein A3K19_13415 [Lentisphaerae bacterium RIFOXYB12_FULL_65_16]